MSATIDDVSQFHDNLIAHLKDKIPNLHQVADYDPGGLDKIMTPAALINVAEMSPGTTVSGGRLAVQLRVEVHCILSVKTDRVLRQIRNMAAAVMRAVYRQRFGLEKAVEMPTDIDAFPGMFKDGEHGFESWVVSWLQTVHLGDGWQEQEFVPEEVFLGEAPRIGAAHKDDYIQVYPHE